MRSRFLNPLSREDEPDLSQTGYLVIHDESCVCVHCCASRGVLTLDPKGEAGSKKCPLHLIPPAASKQIAYAHKYGSDTYGAFNWRATTVCATTYIAAMLRHIDAFRDGEDTDPDSGLSHLAHVGANVNILLDAAACGVLVDDRFKKPL